MNSSYFGINIHVFDVVWAARKCLVELCTMLSQAVMWYQYLVLKTKVHKMPKTFAQQWQPYSCESIEQSFWLWSSKLSGNLMCGNISEVLINSKCCRNIVPLWNDQHNQNRVCGSHHQSCLSTLSSIQQMQNNTSAHFFMVACLYGAGDDRTVLPNVLIICLLATHSIAIRSAKRGNETNQSH